MEEGMPSVVQNVGDGPDARGEMNEQQLVEKLEKSEAIRKKLRQAVQLMKEKLDETSQLVQVNEALREEVERERLNVDTERKRAEAEKSLRESLEKENVSLKEQFVGVLQRLDALESSSKADRSELGRVRSEVKEAVSGIGAALQAVDATKGLYQALERNFHAKINGAVQSSSKALAIAQSGQATTSRAQAAAQTAQSLAKTLQKELQSVSSQVATLQKHFSSLTALESSLQQDSQQLKGPGTPLNSPDAGESNVSLAVPKERVSIDAASPSISLPTKPSIEAPRISQPRDESGEGDMLNILVASTDKPRINPMCSSNGLPPRGGMFLSRNQIPDGGLKSQTTVPQARKSPIKKGSSEALSRDEPALTQPASSSVKRGPVAIITGLDSILSPAVRVSAPKTTPSLYITTPTARANASQVQLQKPPNKRPVVKRSQGDSNVAGKELIPTTEAPAQNVACNTVSVGDDDTPSGVGKDAATKLLKSIMKMFEKEGRNRQSMEEKLMKLQEALVGSSSDPGLVAERTGTKRKRGTRKDKEGSEKGKKRHRESKKKAANFAVTSPPCPSNNKHLLQEKEESRDVNLLIDIQPSRDAILQHDIQASGDAILQDDMEVSGDGDRLSEMISSLQNRCKGEGLFEGEGLCRVNRDAPRAEECKDASSDVDIETVSKDGTGTNTDVESTDDDLGEDWWAKKVLLSPISSTDLPS